MKEKHEFLFIEILASLLDNLKDHYNTLSTFFNSLEEQTASANALSALVFYFDLLFFKIFQLIGIYRKKNNSQGCINGTN